MVRVPSYVTFGVFPGAMHVIKGESQLSKTKAVSNPPCHRKTKKNLENRSQGSEICLRNRRQI